MRGDARAMHVLVNEYSNIRWPARDRQRERERQSVRHVLSVLGQLQRTPGDSGTDFADQPELDCVMNCVIEFVGDSGKVKLDFPKHCACGSDESRSMTGGRDSGGRG